MPELPEVESVRNGLVDLVSERTIGKVTVRWDNIIKEPESRLFQKKLEGQTIETIRRRGKFLLFILTDYVLISHLRMEGKFRLEKAATPLTKHTHVIFSLDDGQELRYLDVRKFGKMSLINKGDLLNHPSLTSLGPEPVEEDLSIKWMTDYLSGKKRVIKACLLDQKLVAGVGNIYADEILYDAGVRPDRSASSLTDEEISVLRSSIVRIMKEAVEAGGTTIRTYANAYGREGSFQNSLKIYGKVGSDCPICHTPFLKTKIAQRGTHYCPICQS
ncbi:DNA-formamidopyrimidine glycosylase [Alkalibacterium pelagium]|jgi:formamidopyrimidine-DNA glycosylase|uniref:Formamidopyrimidine-DNA glycosylase n=1 Tax=Alkalibacterium pelagium TaxID=426702 RepID=A0A1H7NDG6_9LACT|nr:DNA-formamidopyrimidine glycosylase [Alkalibacterium pelagium]GEN51364.1 formamidopyrimidine-DNA glycosylase [Alkalibacterium pelagium]SEL21494.1 DNA-(apurinic or apyrimidinic site) lyase [Alkalibacterium pelagium]